MASLRDTERWITVAKEKVWLTTNLLMWYLESPRRSHYPGSGIWMLETARSQVKIGEKSSVLTAAWLIDCWLVRSVKSETKDIFSEYNSKDEECSSDDGDVTNTHGGVSVSKWRDILHS